MHKEMPGVTLPKIRVVTVSALFDAHMVGMMPMEARRPRTALSEDRPPKIAAKEPAWMIRRSRKRYKQRHSPAHRGRTCHEK